MPAPAFFYRRPVTRKEPFHIERCQPFKRPCELRTAPAREIIASECPVGKYGIAAEEELLFFAEQADASRCVARCVENDKIADRVSLFEHQIRQYPGRAGAKIHRQALRIIHQSTGIVPVDRYFCFAHVRDLFYPGRVIEVAVSEDDDIDPLLVRCYRHGHDPGINEDISHDIGVCPDITIRYPLDMHAQ